MGQSEMPPAGPRGSPYLGSAHHPHLHQPTAEVPLSESLVVFSPSLPCEVGLYRSTAEITESPTHGR